MNLFTHPAFPYACMAAGALLTGLYLLRNTDTSRPPARTLLLAAAIAIILLGVWKLLS